MSPCTFTIDFFLFFTVEVNTFFRLHNPTVIATLRKTFPDLPDELDEKTVFLKLRELRNSW